MNTRNFYEELYQATDALDEARARALLAEGADINTVTEKGWFLLHDLIADSSDEAVLLCLKLGADPHYEDEDGYNMAWALMTYGRYALVLECIDRGFIDVNDTNSRGTTPLMWCCAISVWEDLTKGLLARGADVQRTDRDGINAFGYAIDRDECKYEHFPLLLEAGADINSRDEQGRTALMVYAMGENESPDYISFFLERGADVNLRDPEGKTALSYAYDNLTRCRSGEHTRMNEAWILEMIDLLNSYGAVH